MADFKIIHDRPGCIACGACAALNPDDWKMDERDGLSNLIKGKRTEDHKEELEINQADFEKNKECADGCPVNVIHIIDLKTNEKII